MPSKKAVHQQRSRRGKRPSGSPTPPVFELAKSQANTPEPQDVTSNDSKQLHRHGHLSENNLQVWLPIIFTFLIFLVTAVYSFASILQWQSTEKAPEENRVSRELENRAWVVVKGAEVKDLKVGQPITAVVTYLNSGKTPAVNAKATVAMEVRDTPLPDNPTFRPADIPQAVTNIGAGVEVNSVKILEPLEESTLSMIEGGTKRLYVYGVIEYDDIFGKHHSSSFCLFYKAPILNLKDCGGRTN